jgi:predicted outer membrane repeat protein
VIRSTFSSNTADFGGAIENDDEATVTGGTFVGNEAGSDGGGFYNDEDATLTGVTFRQNLAEYGGGIYNDDELTVRSSKVVSNTASPPSGGGGIVNNEDIDLTDTLVSGNKPENCVPLNTIAGCVN